MTNTSAHLRHLLVHAVNELSSRGTLRDSTLADLRAVLVPELVEVVHLLLDELEAHGVTDLDGGPTRELLRYAKALVGRNGGSA